MSTATNKASGSERRRMARVSLPMHVIIDGFMYDCMDVSIGGVRINNYSSRCGDVEDMEVCLIADDSQLRLKVSARCAFSDEAARISGFSFVNLTPVQAYLLDAIVTAGMPAPLVERGDEFLKYAWHMAQRAHSARCSIAPLAI